MDKILILIQREYIQRVRTRWFLISTIATPLLLIGLSLLPAFAARGGGGPRKVIVFDQSGSPGLFAAIERQVVAGREELLKSVTEYDPEAAEMAIARFDLSQVVVPPEQDLDALKRERNVELGKDPRGAYIVLSKDTLNGAEPEYYARNISDFSIRQLGYAISQAITEQRLVGAGITGERAQQYLKSSEMKLIQIGESGEARTGNQTVLVALFMFLSIFLTIFLYGHSVMQGVIEEKQSRIVEVMLASIKPFSMMMGKIIGIGLVGLTQYLIWVVSALLLTTFSLSLVGRNLMRLHLLSGWMLACFVIYFVLGYFLFATLFAIVGAIASRPEDAHQLQYPVSILLAVPGVMFWMLIRDPNGAPQVALSLVPFFAPTAMMLRMAAVEPPLWQILLSMLLMILTTLAGVWVAAKVYRVGILMTGKRPSIAEVGRWLRYQ